MNIIELLLKELKEEGAKTRKMLECVPTDKLDWRPHPKSMTLRRLCTHLADIPGWFAITFTTSEINFADNPFKEEEINNTEELLNYFDRSLAKGEQQLQKVTEEQLNELWTMRNGDYVISTSTKYEVSRMTFGQLIHHRAQLGVFLRLLNVPIPGSYGPSADEMAAMATDGQTAQ